MKISDLIQLLEGYPGDMEVIVDSYEEGFDPVTDIKEVAVANKADREWYEGVYEENLKSQNRVLLIKSKYNRTAVNNEPI